MQIMTKHYVEMYFPEFSDNNYPINKSVVKIVFERDPLKIYDDLASCFRFFDVIETISDTGEVSSQKRKNYSPMYYFGERLSLKEISELGIFWKNFCIEKGIKSIIRCYNGEFITNPSEGSMTIDELQEKVKIKL